MSFEADVTLVQTQVSQPLWITIQFCIDIYDPKRMNRYGYPLTFPLAMMMLAGRFLPPSTGQIFSVSGTLVYN